METFENNTAIEIAQQVRRGEIKAREVVDSALAAVHRHNGQLNCFTRIFDDSARRDAETIDRQIEQGIDPGPLAGVPFAVKDLFDLAGYSTTAGAQLRVNATKAKHDAVAVQLLKRAGAILIGTLNMDEFAYGFATVNAHFGTTRNPHDLACLAGGSSGGSAAAVAAGLVPLTLGSDTNGSVRVPAALCGVWGIRPADDVISVTGTFPFAEILDTVGPFARSVDDLRLAYNILANANPSDPTVDDQQFDPAALRIGRLRGWFERNASDVMIQSIEQVASHLKVSEEAMMPDAEAARSASFLMTAAQGGALHLETLRDRAMEYDPAVRDRLLAGAMLPAGMYVKAMAFRKAYRQRVRSLLEKFDVLIAPCTPVTAPRIDQATIMIDGQAAPARAQLGLYTQPLSLAGIPIISGPMNRPGEMPVGIQFATAPGKESMLFSLMKRLENEGILRAHRCELRGA
jgi:aspartyl-tRNA(Asn)/glutamyl-tRNA(Gln) amidotransferase subunit A